MWKLLVLSLVFSTILIRTTDGAPKKHPKICANLSEAITAAPEASYDVHICFKSQESFKILKENFIITTIGARKETIDTSPVENSRDYGPSKFEIAEYFRPIVEADTKDVHEHLTTLKTTGDIRIENPFLMDCLRAEGVPGNTITETAAKYPKIQMISQIAKVDNSSVICPSLQLLLGRSPSSAYTINICFNKTEDYEKLKTSYEAGIVASRKPKANPLDDEYYKPSRYETIQFLKTLIDGKSEGIKKFFGDLKYTTAQLVAMKPNDYFERPCIKGKDVPGDLIKDLPGKFREIVSIYQ